jgi:hypothetical protein
LQEPAQAPVPPQAARPPRGVVPLTGQQVPTCCGTSHAWQDAVQASLQQTPSTQRPLAHCCADWQAAPFDRAATHAPASQ